MYAWLRSELPADYATRGQYREISQASGIPMDQQLVYWDGAERAGAAIDVPLPAGREHEATDRARAYNAHLDMATLALAYFYTNDEAYAIKATDFVVAWFTGRDGLRPHLDNSCHERYGKFGERKVCVIEMRDLTWVLDALSLLGESPDFALRAASPLREWCAAYGSWLDHEPFVQEKEYGAKSNHRWYYVLQRAAVSRCAGDGLIAVGELLRVGLDSSDFNGGIFVDARGVMPAEAGRTRSLHYHYFTLTAIIMAERALRATEPPRGKADCSWVEATDPDSGALYWYSATLGESRWERPPLEAHWSEIEVEGGGPSYFYHALTGASRWAPPYAAEAPQGCDLQLRTAPIWRAATLLLTDSAAVRDGVPRSSVAEAQLQGDVVNRDERDTFLCQWVQNYRDDRKVGGRYFVKIEDTIGEASAAQPCRDYRNRRTMQPQRPPPLFPEDAHAGIIPFAEHVF